MQIQMCSLKYTSPPKCMHCKQKANVNVIPNVYSKMHIRDVICTTMHILTKINVHFSQDANANKKPKYMFQT